MATPLLKLKASDLKKVHQELKKKEDNKISSKIDDLKLSHFLTAKASFMDSGDSPEIRTKRIILHINGDLTSDPLKLDDTENLKDDFDFGDDEYTILQIRLNQLVKEIKPIAGISSAEANACDTVGDCVKLVNIKIN